MKTVYQTVTINKVNYPIKFGLVAYHEWENNGGDMIALQKGEVTMSSLAGLIFHALQEGHELADKDFDMDIKGCLRLLDSDKKGLDQVMKLMQDGNPKQVTKEE